MPRNGSGVYSKPAGTTAVSNTTIESAKYNSVVDDLVDDANNPRPVVAGGTGASTAAGSRANLGAQASPAYSTKSSGYTALATDDGSVINCTASLTLALTAAATLGAKWNVTVKANGGDVTIDPNGSETVNGASTYVVYDGNSATVICDGTNFQVVHSGPIITKWVSYTPTIVGLGTTSGVLVLSRRVGENLEIKGSVTAGTSTATTATLSLGFNGVNGSLAVSSKLNSARMMVGSATVSYFAAASFPVLAIGGDTAINFATQSATRAGVTPIEGSAFVGSADYFFFRCSVPIEGWA